MNDDDLRQQLGRIEGEAPSNDFVEGLRGRLTSNGSLLDSHSPDPSSRSAEFADIADVVPMIGTDRRPRRWPAWSLAAAVIVFGGVLLARNLPDDGAPLGTAATTNAGEIGEAWLDAIVENDRPGFVALHAEGLETDDTLMGYSSDVDVLTPARVADLYLDGFDAFQVSLATDGDTVRADGCENVDSERTRCRYSATMLGNDDYSYRVEAELTVEDRQITSISFTEIATEPADLRSEVQRFLDTEADEEDRACLLLGFNTVGCGQHESDFLNRYVAFYEQQSTQADP